LLWIFGAHRLDRGSKARSGAVVPSFRFQAQAAKNLAAAGQGPARVAEQNVVSARRFEALPFAKAELKMAVGI
jgi:hypothetical protein